jgi:hypothetical protein
MESDAQVVWFKRDLRLHDHAPLHAAAKAGWATSGGHDSGVVFDGAIPEVFADDLTTRCLGTPLFPPATFAGASKSQRLSAVESGVRLNEDLFGRFLIERRSQRSSGLQPSSTVRTTERLA